LILWDLLSGSSFGLTTDSKSISKRQFEATLKCTFIWLSLIYKSSLFYASWNSSVLSWLIWLGYTWNGLSFNCNDYCIWWFLSSPFCRGL